MRKSIMFLIVAIFLLSLALLGWGLSPNLVVLPSTDLPGMDYRSFEMDTDMQELCFAACARDPNCMACTCVKAGYLGDKAVCYLKNAVPGSVTNPHTNSATKSSHFEVWKNAGKDRPGMDYQRFTLASWLSEDAQADICLAKCAEDPECRAYTYVRPGIQEAHGVCYLKSGVPDEVAHPGCISGVKAMTTVAVRQISIPWIMLSGIFGPMDLRIDSHGSWLKVRMITPDPNDQDIERTIPFDVPPFIAKGPAGIRDIRHVIQDINGRRTFINLHEGKLVLTFNCETDGMEIKRAAKLAGRWVDDLAYDINITRFNFTAFLGMGSPNSPALTADNIISSVNVEVDLAAEVSNVPDALEMWGIVDRKVKEIVRDRITYALTDPSVKSELFNAIMGVIGSTPELQGKELVNAYLSGNSLVVIYRP